MVNPLSFRSASCVVLLALLVPPPEADAQGGPDWSAWKHHKSVKILGHKKWQADQTNYPIRIVCHKGDGRDGGENAFLGESVRDDFGDVRFRGDNGEQLDYWMETLQERKAATFWVKVPRIPKNGDARIEVYYGNSNAKTQSNGKKTFPQFFDDFSQPCNGRRGMDEHGKPLNDGKPPVNWKCSNVDKGAKQRCEWIVKNGVIDFRGGGHLTTAKKVWPNPAKESYTLRCRAKWPKPAFFHAQENGQSFGGISYAPTDGNAWMNIFVLYQSQANGKIAASFGSVASPTAAEEKNILAYYAEQTKKHWDGKRDLKPFDKTDYGSFLTFEIERKPDETINRIIDTAEEIRSKQVIPADLHLMIHGCGCGFSDSKFLSVNWMLLRKQADPEPCLQWK